MKVATNMSMLPTNRHTADTYRLHAIWIAGSFHRQKAINTVLQGVVYYLDDVSVAGSTWEEHTRSLKNVLQKFGLRQNVFFKAN